MSEEKVHTVTLPNGKSIDDVPVSYTKEQVTELAIRNNLITQEEIDFVPNPNTWADMLPTVGEMGAGMAAGAYGVAQGAATGAAWGVPFGPHAAIGGGLLGGLVGGATASGIAGGVGNFTGRALESLIEGSTFDPAAAISNAVEAAKTDALFSAGFGVGIPALATTGKVIKEWVSALPSADKGIDAIVTLQKELRQRGASLMPDMITDSRGARLSASVSKVSEVSKQTVDRYFKTYSDYMGEQTNKIVLSLKSGTAEEQGKAVQTLIQTTDDALKEIVAPFYQNLSKTGKVQIASARGSLADVATEARAKFRGQRWNKKTKTYEDYTEWGAGGGNVKALVNQLESTPSNLSFFEAHTRLSLFKTKLRDATSGTSAADATYVGLLQKSIGTLQSAMDDAAEELAPALKSEYKKFSTMYKEGQAAITTDYLNKVMRLDDPSKVGAMLTQDGLSVGLKDVQALVNRAKEYRMQLAADSSLIGKIDNLPDPLEGIRRGYIESILGVEGRRSTEGAVVLRRKLNEPKFRDTFNVLFAGTPVPQKIDKLLTEVAILERGAAGSDSAFSLTVRGAEMGAARGIADPTGGSGLTSKVLNILPGFIASKYITGDSVDKLINLVKSANAYAAVGKEVPKGWWVALQDVTTGSKLAQISSAAGVAVGAQSL
jgi:hypothetical protein